MNKRFAATCLTTQAPPLLGSLGIGLAHAFAVARITLTSATLSLHGRTTHRANHNGEPKHVPATACEQAMHALTLHFGVLPEPVHRHKTSRLTIVAIAFARVPSVRLLQPSPIDFSSGRWPGRRSKRKRMAATSPQQWRDLIALKTPLNSHAWHGKSKRDTAE